MKSKILIVDDDSAMLKSCQKVLCGDGHEVEITPDPVEGHRLVQHNHYDLLIVDLKMPQISGIQFMRQARAIHKDIPVIMITAFATLESALRAVSDGAYDYIPKPFSSDQLRQTVQRCMEYQEALSASPDVVPHWDDHFQNIVGDSEGIRQALEVARKVAGLDVNVLLQGESGTGKEIVARGLHQCSFRSSGPFVVIDCASLPEPLMESELFGHEQGAFTGATARKPGLLESAHGGTVFFDEVANMSLNIQSKLLRSIEERKVRRVGGLEMIDLDIRIISATNQDLQSMILEESFRGDLFYRLNVVPIHLPPLRDRKQDIPLLATHFVKEFSAKFKKPVTALSSSSLMAFERYHWPGNVREVRNIVERAISTATGNQITLLDLPSQLVDSYSPSRDMTIERKTFKAAKREATESFEKNYLTRILELAGGNVSRASRMARVGRTAFHRLMKKYGLRSDEFK
ncbi:sigma-54 dependent transcriptional regulator [Acidobacteria bacterium AH-259-D05]|nr:sigma-54 dependent transcriptional regulator [Acidobacteria bacterium AH-259-D05]